MPAELSSATLDRVLIVEDNRDIRAMLRRLVEGWGYACAEAEDGAAALDYVSAHEIALILTDFDMPKLDGLALVHALRARKGQLRRSSIPVILVTGSAQEDVRVRAIAAGVVGIVSKPVDTARLRAMVALGIRRRAETDAEDARDLGIRSRRAGPRT